MNELATPTPRTAPERLGARIQLQDAYLTVMVRTWPTGDAAWTKAGTEQRFTNTEVQDMCNRFGFERLYTVEELMREGTR